MNELLPIRFNTKAPFPWYGGKSQAAPLVWALLGDVDHYCEPFAGSLAVLLNRPHPCNRSYYSETVNDIDCMLVNAWRSIQFSPDATADAASWPVAEADKSARQIALLRWRETEAAEHIAGDPMWHDPVMGGWWLWAVAVQIGAFAGDGAWTSDPVTGRIVKQARGPSKQQRKEHHELSGVFRNLPPVNSSGNGVNGGGLREPGVAREVPHLGNDGQGLNTAAMREPGVKRNTPFLSHPGGQGVNNGTLREPGVKRDRPDIAQEGRGVNRSTLRLRGVSDTPEPNDDEQHYHPTTMPRLRAWFALLSARLRHVRVLNGDWARLCTVGASHTLTVRQGGHVGLFLDPPYAGDIRTSGLYAHDSASIATAVREWALRAGTDPHNRIVIAGYDTEHTELVDAGWTEHEWFAHDGLLRGGMGDQQHRERLWSSPYCLALDATRQLDLFADRPAADPEDARFAEMFAEAAE
jgi:site-specific DNA-adenine methylase